jgi:hypothetical protein
MEELSGKTSDRIRRGEIDADPLKKVPPRDDSPSPEAIRHGRGRSLGRPERSDRSAKTEDR